MFTFYNSLVCWRQPCDRPFPLSTPFFACTASACSDNCCIGWEIDIDSRTAGRYRSLSQSDSPLARRLREDICWDFPPHFRLTAGERCPFLNEQNLCDIYLHLGEDALCEICDQHPRFHEWFCDYKESGLGLCCEEAARLLLSDPEPLRLQTVTTDEKPDLDLFDPDLLRELLQLRGQLFSLLQDRSLSLFERFTRLLRLGSLAQWQLNNSELPFSLASDSPLPCAGNAEPGAQPLRELLGFLAGLEPIDPQWPAYLQDLSRRLEELLAHRQDFLSSCAPQLYVYEKLCAYTLYRYLHKAVWDGDLFSRVKFAVCFALLALLQDLDTFSLTGALPLRDQILHTKAISKELDYSEENLDAFCDQSWKSPSLSCEGFCSMISLLLG